MPASRVNFQTNGIQNRYPVFVEHMSQAEAQHEVNLKKLSFYRSEIKHEFTLLSSRMNAYVTSQSFLMIAFASAMNNTNPHWGKMFTLVFPVGLALLGMVTSLRAYQGIVAAVHTIASWHGKQNQLFENDLAMDDYRVQRSRPIFEPDSSVDAVHQSSLTFAQFTPRVFLIAWCLFSALAVFLHVKS